MKKRHGIELARAINLEIRGPVLTVWFTSFVTSGSYYVGFFLGQVSQKQSLRQGLLCVWWRGWGGDFWMKGGEECRVGQGKELSKDVFSSWNLDSA